ncbi:helix-turn-helix domain-containing protein [Caenispirillum bisanense]|uniref:Helix-turn-helix domain-containing protein n=1 Tax=Caenispirillum bisanense TaxID=414052 RepID=A0A286GLX8_9PROT|nr:helix-turn-helix domain-containing protein [Caenispirillum bisanense]SOD96543.1 Helix-turn-helix domain-containing protein [Caenispirillum bisanense]
MTNDYRHGNDIAVATAANDNNPLSDHLTQEQAAEILGVSVRTLQRLHASRRGPARIKIGRVIMYRVEAIREWLAANENGTVGRPSRRRG